MDEIFEKLIHYRRELHKIPEICFNEYKTSSYIKNELNLLGIDYKEIASTGIVAFIKGKENTIIAFRADMDGLAIEEKNEFEYKSQHQGFMHACGHDFHMAILLAIANHYSKIKAPCNIMLIFQPAEEGGGGALKMLSENIFSYFGKPNFIFGLHVNPSFEYDQIAYAPGAAWAGSCEFEIELSSKGGHGAEPHNSTDLLYVFSLFYSGIQGLLSRKKDIKDLALITIGKLKGFEIPNVLSSNCLIGGTFRFFSETIYRFLGSSICNYLDSLKVVYDFNYFYREKSVYPPLINDENLSENFYNLILDLNSDNFKIQKVSSVMISEDYSYFLKQIPGIYFFLGVKTSENQKLHTADFNPDERALKTGFELYRTIVENYKRL